jgi:mRNA interferase RelE/StbE
LHPLIKPSVKKNIQRLRKNPYLGKALEKELSGYYSLRSKRFRIIYKIDNANKSVQVHYVGHRRDIYEIFKRFYDNNSALFRQD